VRRLTSRLQKARPVCLYALQVPVMLSLACGSPAPLTVEMPLHLEEHLDAATIVGSEVPEDMLQPVEWRFDEPQPDWRAVKPVSQQQAIRPIRVDDALRLPLTAANRNPVDRRLVGAIYVDLPDWSLQHWGAVEIRARTRDYMAGMGLVLNYTEDESRRGLPFSIRADGTPLVSDGTVQTYRLSLDPGGTGRWEGPWTQLGIDIASRPGQEAASLDILSVLVFPRASEFAEARAGVREVQGGTRARVEPLRRTLYMHAPGRIAYQVSIPEDARLDVGLGVLREDAPVTFAITAAQPNGEIDTLCEETYSDREHWGQRSVDLSHLAGETTILALETASERPGTVALWASPTLSGPRATERPNVIFYIIDGAGADLMSVYGYNRSTTPNLERLASEGAVFERAYSNASWTQPSTLSFMTSLQHSVASLSQGVRWARAPEEATTMAQHVHRAGYQTAVLVSNDYAGRISGLERGVDKMRDQDPEDYSISSVLLHEDFWEWREDYPGEPYWVHFQTTDIHTPWRPVAPFAGLFVTPTERRAFDREFAEVGRMPGPEDFERTGIDRVAHFNTARGVYDEAMAHQDYQIGRLVERLKANGEWEHTLLIVAADHSHFHAGLSLLDPLPPELDTSYAEYAPMISSWISHIPLIFVWPKHITAGMRFGDPVSMIDMLPTVLDLLDLPKPEVMQGQSLAPLLLGKSGWEPRPVVLDEIGLDRATGEPTGRIEVVDGRWGASLYVDPDPEEDFRHHRPVPLLLYDLWNDPYCLHSIHEDRPDLVEKYTAFLEVQFAAHQALGQLFTPAEGVVLTPDQLETLRALGYIQ